MGLHQDGGGAGADGAGLGQAGAELGQAGAGRGGAYNIGPRSTAARARQPPHLHGPCPACPTRDGAPQAPRSARWAPGRGADTHTHTGPLGGWQALPSPGPQGMAVGTLAQALSSLSVPE